MPPLAAFLLCVVCFFLIMSVLAWAVHPVSELCRRAVATVKAHPRIVVASVAVVILLYLCRYEPVGRGVVWDRWFQRECYVQFSNIDCVP